jgi:predicted nucleotidyltransferase
MESAKLTKLKRYQKELKKLLNNNLIDIIIFGSFVKGGSPKDIDLALVVKGEIEIVRIKSEIKRLIEAADIQIISIISLYSPIWITLIKEGFSVNKNKFLFELYKIKPVVLYKYSLSKLNNTQKVQFERGIKKVIGKEGSFLTRSVVLIPLTMKNEMMEFLKTWNIYYETNEYELLPILRKEEFI